MGNRSIIRVVGVNYAEVYKHWDGSLHNMLPWLTNFVQDFKSYRGKDPEYCLAQLLRSSAKMAKEFRLDDSDYTGYGVVPFGSIMGQDFIYTLDSELGTVEVHEC